MAGEPFPVWDRPADADSTVSVPVFRVEELVAGGSEAVLVHGDKRYSLRITARGKLILTK